VRPAAVDPPIAWRWLLPDHVHFGDGESMRLSTDLVDMKREIERFEGVDGFEGFLGFMQESHRHYEHSVDHVLHRNFYSLFSMLRPSFLPYVQQLHPFEALVRFSSFPCRGGSCPRLQYKRASIYFKTDRMRRAFTFAAMYMGRWIVPSCAVF
jgi:phytoene desaturase (3,4-didehydrolycopene-forming)